MVYRGKVSQGCYLCKTRRIKCDQTKPSCKQCARVNKACPGYKRKEVQPPPGQRPDQGARVKLIAPRPEIHSSALEYLETKWCIRGPPRQPIKEQATCHFIANYVLIPHEAHLAKTVGYLEYVIPLITTKTLVPHLQWAFNACALASLHNRVGTGNNLDALALKYYTAALTAIATALSNPETARLDATLAAVLLLGHFEIITTKSLNILPWSSHVEGAIELVKMRGPNQVNTSIGLDLFIATRTQMIIHCLKTGLMPPGGVEWWIEHPDDSGCAWYFQRLTAQTGELKARLNSLMSTVTRNPKGIKQIQDMLQNCKTHDAEIVAALDDLPASFGWEIVGWESRNPTNDYSDAKAFPGPIHVYRDLWIANLWNVMRGMRLALAALSMRCTAWLDFPADYRTTPEYAITAKTCVENINDIIASVPYHTGWCSKRKDLQVQSRLSGFACGEDVSEKCLAGYFLLWPLANIQGQDYLTNSQRDWVKGRLRYIGDRLGVRYGNVISQLNVREPSMMIQRDRLMNDAYQLDTTPKPDTDRSLVLRQALQRQRLGLIKHVADDDGEVDDWTIKTYLQL